MNSSTFAYKRPKTLEEALDVLRAKGPDARLLAGGHSLIPLLKMRLANPAMLVDLKSIPGLSGISEDGSHIRIGALTTHAEIARSALVHTQIPLLAEAAARIGDVQVRNRGTIGGSLCHADPSADFPAVAVALDAEMDVASADHRRSIPVDQWFLGPLTTSLGPGELLTAIRFPKMATWRTAYEKFPHPASGYATVGVAVALQMGTDGQAQTVRIGVTGASPTAFRARETESMLESRTLSDDTIHQAAQQVTNGVEIMGDLFASQEYRRHLCSVYTARALMRARG